MAGLDTRGGRRTPDHVEASRNPSEAIKANVLKVFEGVDLQTPGVSKLGLITYTVLKGEAGMRAIAHVGALRVAQIDEGIDIWGCKSEGETAYTLFGDIGHNYSKCVTEKNGRPSGGRGGAREPGDRYEVINQVDNEMLEPL